MKKFFPTLLAAVSVVLILGSCASSKNVAYFQNADSISLAASKMLYDAKIMPKDQLTITVNTTDPEAAKPFNLAVSQTLECEALIREKIAPYMAKEENPIVTVRMASYRVTVTGEVARPGVVSVPTEKMSVIEALAQCGDLTVYGKRENVMLIREDAQGEKHIYRLNLNDANIINSPYYYLQQNDILYVEPNSVKTQNASIGQATQLWFSFASILTSVAALVVNILK